MGPLPALLGQSSTLWLKSESNMFPCSGAWQRGDKKKGEINDLTFFLSGEVVCYFFRLARALARPTRPVPKSSMVAGSGTGAGLPLPLV